MEANRYTVLLVDDEEEVTQIIMKKIDWESLGFSVIGSANNGVKALEMVEEFQPDIVMTDIRMPYMDGMELAHRVKAEFPSTRIFLFTGFDEFEYAKEAIHLEVEEYILKPVNAAELTKVFSQTKIKLDQEISEKRNVEILQNYYIESLPFLQTNFYVTLIEGRIQEEELGKYLEDYQISMPGPVYCCVVIHTSSTQDSNEMSPLLLSTSVQKQVKERLAQKWDARYFSYLGNSVLIAQLKNEGEVSELTDECDRFCKYARRMIGAVVTAGVGKVCRQLSELQQSYEGAREAVSYRGIYGAERAINIREIVPQGKNQPEEEGESQLTGLFRAIRFGREDEVREAVSVYIRRTVVPVTSLQQYQIGRMELLSALYRFCAANEIPEKIFSGDMGKLYTSLLEKGPKELEGWLLDLSLSLRELLIHARSSSTKTYVKRAEEYIHSSYADAELSLDYVCELLGVSNSYFSTVFKKETGKSFTAYLTDYRMEQASRMLLETGEKSYVIAKNVGYADSNYFSYVFKRKFGVAPSQYRTEHMNSEA